jgi:hypothetical protein
METKFEQVSKLKTRMEVPLLTKYIQNDLIEKYKAKGKYRERIYGLETVLIGMIYQTLNDDSSEQNAVIYISEYYKKKREEIEEEKIKKELETGQIKRKRGRPLKHKIKVQKSKLKPISLNTASYDEARQRFPIELAKEIFYSMKLEKQTEKHWLGHKVYIVDGSTLKTPETEELRKSLHPQEDTNPQPLPTMRIEGLIDLYGGNLVDIEMDNYNSSEMRMLKKLYRSIPSGTILLGDDLYSSYGHIAYCKQQGVEIVTQGKHKRKDKIISKNATNDVIVEWSANIEPQWYEEGDLLPENLQVRRICYINPKKSEEQMYLYTTLMDSKKYKALDILALYFRRWDIELGFREIKKILNMEFLRSKTLEMIKKEVYIHLILYNILRMELYRVLDNNNIDFFSLGAFIQADNTIFKNKSAYVDKLGRSYAKASTGRNRRLHNEDKKEEA